MINITLLINIFKKFFLYVLHTYKKNLNDITLIKQSMLYRSQKQSKMFHCIRQADTTQHYSVVFVLQCHCRALTNNNANHAMETKNA